MMELADLGLWAWLAIIAIVLVSAWVHGALGLGFPLLATPALATIMDVRSAILITLLPTMAVNIASIAGNQGGFTHARRHLPLIGFVLGGSILGATALAVFDPAPFRLLLAGLILFYLWVKLRVPQETLSRHPWLFMGIFGMGAGLAAGTTNAMVTVLIIYFLSLDMPRRVMVPVLNACFLTGKLSQFAVLTVAGYVTWPLLWQSAPLAMMAVAALLGGRRIQSRIDASSYQKLLRLLLLLLALVLIFQYVLGRGLLT
jgi:uncharacterized membrane protein YfcA